MSESTGSIIETQDALGHRHAATEVYVQRIAVKFDLLFYQYYALWDEQEILLDRFARLTHKPIFHGDSACSVPDEKMPDSSGPHCVDQNVFNWPDREQVRAHLELLASVGGNYDRCVKVILGRDRDLTGSTGSLRRPP